MKPKKPSILRFIWMSILFGCAGFCALTFLVIRDPRWFRLYWRVMRFFGSLPSSLIEMKRKRA
ncbi:MAG: hypothetical protein DRH70_09490 [Candidatus Coatesbacteria bacterium]|nr:MAG: hypothetical protein DRH70_09490 [Candidatus Coatesbacteria bacterium]